MNNDKVSYQTETLKNIEITQDKDRRTYIRKEKTLDILPRI